MLFIKLEIISFILNILFESSMPYKEREKSVVREEVLEKAVKILTESRYKSTLINSDYIYKVRDQLLKEKYWNKIVSKLKDETVQNWRNYYESIVSMKKPSQLRVAYLSGPNPENDLSVLVKLGILPENVWAFESDSDLYASALRSILNSKFPHMKIQKSKISEFFKTSPLKFDIIYLDFCGPLPNRNKKQKNLPTIVTLLEKHALNSPGVLITNFSLPSIEQDIETRNLLAKMVAYYLYPKDYIEKNQNFIDGIDKFDNADEGAKCCEYTFEEWIDLISNNLNEFYGQFITRLIMDLASYIIPNYFFASNKSYIDNYFKGKIPTESSNKEEYIYLIFQRYFSKSIISSLESLYHLKELSRVNEHRRNNKGLNLYAEKDQNFIDFSSFFLGQLSPTNRPKDLIRNLENLSFFMQENRVYDSEQYYTKELQNLANIQWKRKIFQFCDVFLFHQVLEFLVRQLAVPYHINISSTSRWSYVAKETRMFLDMFVFDECRYLYDWMPTLDNFLHSIEDIERQFVFRFALDGINRHTRWYFEEYFAGTACVEKYGKKGFEYLTLKRRKYLN